MKMIARGLRSRPASVLLIFLALACQNCEGKTKGAVATMSVTTIYATGCAICRCLGKSVK